MLRMHNTRAGRVFDVFNFIFLVALGLVMLLPFIYVIAGSFATEAELSARSFFLWPHTFTLNAYKYIFSTQTFVRSLLVTVGITVVGTLFQLVASFTFAYPLSRKKFRGRNAILNLVIFCMLFGGGMIPTYLVVKALGMVDTYWAVIIPGCLSPFNLILIKNFFQSIPEELEESAKMDGANESTILLKIFLPLSKPLIATMTLFYAVGHWNSFMGPLIYLNDSAKWPIQLLLRQLTMASNAAATLDVSSTDMIPPEQGLKLAVIVVATLPILMFYPFLQKHFAKGMMVGSVKG